MQERPADIRQFENGLLDWRRCVKAEVRNVTAVAYDDTRGASPHLEPVPSTEEAFELRILVAHARRRARIVGIVQAKCGSREAILPDAIRAFAHPALAEHALLGIVERDAENVGRPFVGDAIAHDEFVAAYLPRHFAQRPFIPCMRQFAVAGCEIERAQGRRSTDVDEAALSGFALRRDEPRAAQWNMSAAGREIHEHAARRIELEREAAGGHGVA